MTFIDLNSITLKEVRFEGEKHWIKKQGDLRQCSLLLIILGVWKVYRHHARPFTLIFSFNLQNNSIK